MSVTFNAKTVPIISTRSKTSDVRIGPSSTSGVPCDTGPLGEHAEPRGAEESTEIYTEEVRPGAEAPGLTPANLKRLEDKDPVAAALASVVSSLPPSETTPIRGLEEMTKVSNAKVKAWRRAARKEKGKEAGLGPMFGATWGDETLKIAYGKLNASASAHSSEWQPDRISEEPTLSKEPEEPEFLQQLPSPRGLAPEP